MSPETRTPGNYHAAPGKAIRDLSKGRICSVCKLYKDREHFYLLVKGFNGLMARCKTCIKVVGFNKEKKREWYHRRRNTGKCVRCGDIRLEYSNLLCKECWFRDRANSWAGGDLEGIKHLWAEQGGQCLYTGVNLTPGLNASLDHNIPRSRGGSNNISNLRWTSCEINIMKNDRTHEEFIKLCRIVTARFADCT